MRKHTTCLHTWCPTVNASCRVLYKCIWANFQYSLPTFNLRFWPRQKHAPILPMTFTDFGISMHVKGSRNKYIRGVERSGCKHVPLCFWWRRVFHPVRQEGRIPVTYEAAPRPDASSVRTCVDLLQHLIGATDVF
jgi:hypothetical protein